MDNDDKTVAEIVRRNEQLYVSGTTTLSKYVQFSMFENIEKIEAYLNSKHISGEFDALGREKPFFNIVTAAVNIWYRATDIDRKDIKIKATKSTDILGAFLATYHLQNWMKKESFGIFLNDWGRSLVRYGSSIIKFVEKNGELVPSVMPWGRMIVDTIDFDNDVQIEVLEYTPAMLLKEAKRKGYNKEKVDSLLDAFQSRQTRDKQNKDTKNDFIKVYEVHGELSLETLKRAQGKHEDIKEGDCDIYVQQMQVISYVAKADKDDEFDDFVLFAGREKKSPYMITHLIKEEGRTQSIGAVEHLFEAQWMKNHTVKLIKDQLDLASKLVFQTSDPAFVGMNAIDNIETGDILVYEDNKPLTQLQNNSHDISALQAYGNDWKALGQEVTSTPDALAGNNMPSGTAYRQVAILNQEAHSLFEIMIENKGLAIEQMMRIHILPFIQKQMDTTDEIATTLDSLGLKKVDLMYINAEVAKRNNKKMAEEMFNMQLATPIDVKAEAQKIQGELAMQGSQRFFKPSELDDKTWKEIFADLTWETEIEVSGEESNKEAVMTTLTTVLQTIATNPMVLNNPTAKVIFNKILETAGSFSPVEIQAEEKTTPNVPVPSPMNPQQKTAPVPSTA